MTSERLDRNRFATTQWSLVLAAARGEEDNQEALERLCSLYWYPVFAFVRRKVGSTEDAQDLTQGFFTRLLEKQELGHADRTRGRFRSFLLSACEHYIANEHDRRTALKRGGNYTMVHFDFARVEALTEKPLESTETPERVYERQWARTLMNTVLETLRRDYAQRGEEHIFDRLSGFLTDSDVIQTEAARDLGMSLSAVKMSIHRMKKRYRQALRQTVADTVSSPEEVDGEIRHLMSMVGE